MSAPVSSCQVRSSELALTDSAAPGRERGLCPVPPAVVTGLTVKSRGPCAADGGGRCATSVEQWITLQGVGVWGAAPQSTVDEVVASKKATEEGGVVRVVVSQRHTGQAHDAVWMSRFSGLNLYAFNSGLNYLAPPHQVPRRCKPKPPSVHRPELLVGENLTRVEAPRVGWVQPYHHLKNHHHHHHHHKKHKKYLIITTLPH